MGKNFKIPRMAEPKSVTVSALADGGLNLAKRACDIADGESPDMLNFWKHQGQLRLRPGLRKGIEHRFGTVIDVYPRDGRSLLIRKVTNNGVIVEEKYGIYIVTPKEVLCYDGKTAERVASSLSYDNGWASDYADYSFKKCVFLPSGSTGSSSFAQDGLTWTASGDTVYLIGSGYFLAISPQVVVYENPTAVPHITATCLIGNVEPHVPVLYVNCTAAGTGTKVEERNMLSSKCIQKFTTDATSSTYYLCDTNIDNVRLTAIYNAGNGSLYSFDFDPDCTLTIQNGIRASLNRREGTIYFTSVLVDANKLGIKNNLVVTYCKTVCDEIPLCYCSIGMWYDGGSQTANSYSRMFLSGNENMPNRIYYSVANDPTYFAQDTCIDIGVPAEPITAFGIQYDILAVFKARSIYSLSYSGTTDSATFTIKEVNSSVGCDMPATLKLASNALIWGSSTGGIYALQSTTIKDERAVRLISQNINTRLLATAAEDLQSASAICDGTSYFLLAGSCAFILNYELLHFISGQNPEGIAWFIWSLPQKLSGIFRYYSCFAASSPADGTVYLFDDDSSDDCGSFFDAYWYSKSFDFGLPEQLKRLYRFMLTFGCDEAVKIEICFCDSASERRQTVTVDRSDSWEKSLVIRPAAAWSRNASIGVRRMQGTLAPFSIIDYAATGVCGAQIG